MKRLMGVLLLTLLTITGCSAIDSGKITEKEFTPSYTYMQTYCAAYGTKGMCIAWMSREVRVADDWTLHLKAREKTGWVDVSQATYDSYRVGDYYHAPEEN